MHIILRIVLTILGLATLTIGLNVGLGGIHTLNWQYAPGLTTEAKPVLFNLQDSLVHFLSGIFSAVGLILAAAAVVPKLVPAAITVRVKTFPGAVFRLIDMAAALFSDGKIIQS